VADLREQTDMKTVPLHGAKAAGRVAIVDDADYDLVMQHRWRVWELVRANGTINGPYAVANLVRDGRPCVVRMHMLLTGWALTDHQDRNTLNNRRSNLRPATFLQNLTNQGPHVGSASRYKGVGWHKRLRKWYATINDGKRRHLGCFISEEAAARAYDAAASAAWGEFAYLNFPE
jgi:hypothetical protein